MPQQKNVYQTVEPKMMNNFVSQKSPNIPYGHTQGNPAFNSMQTVNSAHMPTN